MSTFLQITNRVADSITTAAQGAVTGHSSPDMLDLMFKGGFVFYVLLVAFGLSIYFIIERLFYIKKRTAIDYKMLGVINDKMSEGKIKDAIEYCDREQTTQSRIMSTALRFLGGNAREIESAMEAKAQVELSAMEGNLSYLSLISRTAPMLGFVGTIWGVIKIFYTISIDSNLSIGGISEGLYTKMITSLAGLSVGIFAFVGYSLLMRYIDRYAEKMQEQSISFLEMLNRSGK